MSPTPNGCSVFETTTRIRRSPRLNSANRNTPRPRSPRAELDSVRRSVFQDDSDGTDKEFPSPPSPLLHSQGDPFPPEGFDSFGNLRETNVAGDDDGSITRGRVIPRRIAPRGVTGVENSRLSSGGDAAQDELHCHVQVAGNEDTQHTVAALSEGSTQQAGHCEQMNVESIVPPSETVEEENKELRCLYYHLNRVTAVEQKAIASACGVAQVGNKKVRAARIYLALRAEMRRTGCSALDVLMAKGDKSGADFKGEFDCTMNLAMYRKRAESTSVPATETLEAIAGVAKTSKSYQNDKPIDDESDRDDDITAVNFTATGISLEEFARLMIIFRDIPEAADDLRKSGEDLSREDLDTGRTRGAFWTDRIEVLFNDSSVLTNEQFEAPLQDIDPGRPVTQHLSGSYLKDVFAKFRHEFTETYAKWNTSGNNAFANFINFCYLPRTKTLSRAGTRCLIAHRVFRFGLPGQNTLLLDFCSKQMAEGSGARLESGLQSSAPSGVTMTRSNKRLSDNGLSEDIRSLVKSISEQNGSEDQAMKKQKAEIDELRLKRARREDDRYVMQQLMETHEHRLKLNHPVDNRVTVIVDSYYKRLVEEAAKKMQT